MKMAFKALTDLEVGWSELQLIKQRQRKETLREVYTDGERYIFKRYIINKSVVLYPRPWISEATALVRAEGLPVPKYVETYAGNGAYGSPEFVFKRTLLVGHGIEHLSVQYVEAMAALLAALHQRGVVTRDANIDNFLLAPDGAVCFVDFGKARAHCFPSYYDIGSELARFVHGTLVYDEDLWQRFRNRYYEVRQAGPISRFIEQFFYHLCKRNRMRRRSISF